MPQYRTTRELELPLLLVRHSGIALRRQLEDWLRGAIRDRTLSAGATLPATRTLAHDLGVSRGVVVEAYTQLAAEGYLLARRGSATVVAPVAGISERDGTTAPRAPEVRYDFRPGTPDVGLFPRTAWAAALRYAVRTAADGDLGYGDPAGTRELRRELATYLRRVRGVAAEPDDLVITSGFAQGLGLVCRALRAMGMTELAMEDPCHPGQRALVADAGLTTLAVPVDEQGVRVDILAATPARAVLVTPAHQFPTGIAYSAARRAQLLHWARERDAVIIEDDYDAEYRYDRAPVGALQGLDPAHVVYAGSASKMLAPALRLGWLVVPAHLGAATLAAKRLADLGSPVLDQLALAQFLERGLLDRHLRRARAIYRARRDALRDALTRYAPQVRIHGIAAGLHAVAELTPTADEALVVAAARACGVGVYGGRDYYAAGTAPYPTLVLGYGALSPHAIERAVALLAPVLGGSSDVAGITA